MDALIQLAEHARAASLALCGATTEQKNLALLRAAEMLAERTAELLAANALDVRAAGEKGLKTSFIERLTLSEARIRQMADGLRAVARLDDPVGAVIEAWTRPNGLKIRKRRVALGVIAIIYESRPNVTVDAAALCLKAGSSVVLRGGSDAFESNRALARVLADAACEAGLPEGSVQLVEDTSRETAERLMTLNEYIDVLIPRGGKGLIRSVIEKATVPVIQTGDGVCHVYVDGACELDMAVELAVSARVSRPSVCNSAETLLVDRAVAGRFLPPCLAALREAGVEVRGCPEVAEICDWVVPATDADWDTEYNDLIYSVKVVDGVEEAVNHINRHGTRHSEAIVTADAARAAYFQRMVDAAAVYWNASTRFTDGGEFGFGAEIGISNQKLHARGPMGLSELTTYKYEIDGSGQVR
ncbi:MAG: glutamate-5-semialdehyde dehydrogenase [Christensenellaceae bacterium]|nr:glutamate-5-semialdehyde dehydrogenase [Christensenellaceae bacterium]